MNNPEEKVETNFKYTSHDGADGFDDQSDLTNHEDIEEPIEKADEPLFNWSAPDSFSNNKSFGWYLSLFILTVIISAIIYLITKDKITTSVVAISGLLIGIYATKKPRIINYQLTKRGFTVNGRFHNLGEYRSFALVHHGHGASVVLTPLKRFMPYMYIYFGGDMEQQILSALIDVLPKQNDHTDIIDKFLRKIGF